MAATHYQIFCRYYHSTVNRAVINDIHSVNAYNWIAASDIKSSKIIKDYMPAADIKYSFISSLSGAGITGITGVTFQTNTNNNENEEENENTGDVVEYNKLTITKDNSGNNIYTYDNKVVLVNKEIFTGDTSILYTPIRETEIIPAKQDAKYDNIIGLKIVSKDYSYFSSENMTNKSYFYNDAEAGKDKLFFSLEDYETYKESIENAWIRFEDYLLSKEADANISYPTNVTSDEQKIQYNQVAYLREARDLDSALNEVIMNETSETNPKYDMMFIYDGLATEKAAKVKHATGKGFSTTGRKWRCYDTQIEKLPKKWKQIMAEIVDAYKAPENVRGEYTEEKYFENVVNKYWFTEFDEINENMFISDDNISEDTSSIVILDDYGALKKYKGFYCGQAFQFYNLLADPAINNDDPSNDDSYYVISSLGNKTSNATTGLDNKTLKICSKDGYYFSSIPSGASGSGAFSLSQYGSSATSITAGKILRSDQVYMATGTGTGSGGVQLTAASFDDYTAYSFYKPNALIKQGIKVSVGYSTDDSKFYTLTADGKNIKDESVNSNNADHYFIIVSRDEAKKLMCGEKVLFQIYMDKDGINAFKPSTDINDTESALFTTTLSNDLPSSSCKTAYQYYQATSSKATLYINGVQSTIKGNDEVVAGYDTKNTQYFGYSDIAYAVLGVKSYQKNNDTDNADFNIWTWEDESDMDKNTDAVLEESNNIAPYVYYEKFKRFEFSPWFVYANCGSLNFAMTKAEELVNIVGLENVLIGKTVDLTQYIEIE